MIGNLRKKVKTLQRCVQRQRTKITTMNDLIDELPGKRLIESDPAAVLRNCLDGSVLENLQNQIAKNDRTPEARRTYSRLCLFTTRLNCREPIGSRPCSVHCPDFTTYIITTRSRPNDSLNAANWCLLSMTDVIKAFGTLPQEYRDCSLVIDSMSLRKQTLYDDVDGKYVGFCDFGGLIAEDPDTVASEALVFILVPLRGSTKDI